jgi:putative DNA methylase
MCTWATTSALGRLTQAFGRQALEMVWDFAESNPFSQASGSFLLALNDTSIHAKLLSEIDSEAIVKRGSAANPPFNSGYFDAIVTDPPYYDNIFYADLSDFFFVWQKRTIGDLFPAHFATFLAPKKNEIVASPWRHENKLLAKEFYESLLFTSLQKAQNLLKPHAPLIVVYAHKTTAGWASLIDALRHSGFIVTEAWPLDTELTGHRKADAAALASSIFLVARRRETNNTGSYENQVLPDLFQIVHERVESLWSKGVTGADLVIACVGAGLRAFTRYARVEYANGEEVPAESYLTEVEGAVLEGLLEKIFGVNQAGVSAVDAVTRFYVLWRYTYRHAAIEAGEAIIFAYPQQVELDGAQGLTGGSNPLVLKKGSKYQLLDFTARGDDETLGLPRHGADAPLIDVLHRLLYLVENRPHAIPGYLDQARPDVERLRVVAQTLAGQTLAGNGNGGGKSLVAARGAEAAALRKLTTNWRALIEQHRGGLV